MMPQPPAGSPQACPDATAAALAFGGLTDDQIARAYGAFGLYTDGDLGAGQRVGIYELEPFERSDIKTFDTCFFGGAAAGQMASRLHVYKADGGQPAGQGSGEAILDIENVSVMAPGAQIDVYEAPNTTIGGLDGYAAIVNADRDHVVTTSWGLCEQAIQLGSPGLQQAENSLFEQAAAQGQSIFAAAGDSGDDDCNSFYATVPPAGQNPLSVDDPGSQPYVISAGGTTINDAATQPPQEQVWNDGANDGGGGADFGNPNLASDDGFPISYQTGTEIQVAAPAEATSTDQETVPLSFFSVGGQSTSAPVTYAGVPVVASVLTTSGGLPGAADTGGTPIMIVGQGFDQAVGPIAFMDAVSPYSTGTQYTYSVNSDTSISTQTVSQNPALVDVEVCTVTACSLNPPADHFILYPPGNPVVSSITPTSGPTAGGTSVTITGENLGCVTAVFFGTVAAMTATNTAAILDCGSTTQVTATAPPGTAGATVPVTVTTVESDLTGSGPSTSSASFTYTP